MCNVVEKMEKMWKTFKWRKVKGNNVYAIVILMAQNNGMHFTIPLKKES